MVGVLEVVVRGDGRMAQGHGICLTLLILFSNMHASWVCSLGRFWSLGLHHQCSGTVSFRSCTAAFHSETSLIGAAGVAHFGESGEKSSEKKETAMSKQIQNDTGRDRTNTFITLLGVGLLMVTLVRSAVGGNFI